MYTVYSLQLYSCTSFNNAIKFILQKTLIIGWILATLCNGTILFGFDNKNVSLSLSILYLSLSRVGWTLGIAWVVVVCTTSHAGNSIFFMSLINALMLFFLL